MSWQKLLINSREVKKQEVYSVLMNSVSFWDGEAERFILDEGVKLKNMYCQKPGKILALSMPPFKVYINQQKQSSPFCELKIIVFLDFMMNIP